MEKLRVLLRQAQKITCLSGSFAFQSQSTHGTNHRYRRSGQIRLQNPLRKCEAVQQLLMQE